MTRSSWHMTSFDPLESSHPSVRRLLFLAQEGRFTPLTGVHTSSTFPIPPPSLYDKNVSLAFGRCPVRALIEPASTVLQKYHDVFSVCGFIDKIVPIRDEEGVKEVYRAFDQREVGKVIFAPWT